MKQIDSKINAIHRQVEELFTKHGVETFVSIKAPNGDRYNMATARKGTLAEVSRDLDEKLKNE